MSQNITVQEHLVLDSSHLQHSKWQHQVPLTNSESPT